jgi:hypothetical protein
LEEVENHDKNKPGNSFKKNKRSTHSMNKLFRGLIAGYGAKKLGGGCLSTILIFIVIWVLLGKCE